MMNHTDTFTYLLAYLQTTDHLSLNLEIYLRWQLVQPNVNESSVQAMNQSLSF